jgi:hypothetical protein
LRLLILGCFLGFLLRLLLGLLLLFGLNVNGLGRLRLASLLLLLLLRLLLQALLLLLGGLGVENRRRDRGRLGSRSGNVGLLDNTMTRITTMNVD